MHAILAALLLSLSTSADEPLTPAQVLAKADALQQADTSHMLMEQTITTTSGATRTFRIESWSTDGNDKSVMRFLSPAPSAGIGMLSLDGGDNIWAYFPDSDDLRKIASSARKGSMEGSDFSYEDMSGGNWSEDWQATTLVEEDLDEHPCYRVTATPQGSSSYTHMEIWVDRESFLTYQVWFFDKKERHGKTLSLSDWQQIDGVWTPQQMTMKNLLRGSQTSIHTLQVAYGVELEPRLFTTDFLTSM